MVSLRSVLVCFCLIVTMLPSETARCLHLLDSRLWKLTLPDDGSHVLPTPTDDSPEGRRGSVDPDDWTEQAEEWHRSSKAATTNAQAAVMTTSSRNPNKRTMQHQPSLEQLQEKVFELETYVRAPGCRPMSSEKLMGMGHPAGPGATNYVSFISAKYKG